MIDPLVQLCIVVLLAFVFGQAAAHKLTDYSRYLEVVADYRIVWPALTRIVAALMLVLEVAVIALLVVPASRAAGLLLGIALLFGYAAAIGLNLHRGRSTIDCGCGRGDMGQPISTWLLLRNGVLIVLAASATFPLVQRSIGIIDWLNFALAGSAMVVVYMLGDLLIANASKLKGLKA